MFKYLKKKNNKIYQNFNTIIKKYEDDSEVSLSSFEDSDGYISTDTENKLKDFFGNKLKSKLKFKHKKKATEYNKLITKDDDIKESNVFEEPTTIEAKVITIPKHPNIIVPPTRKSSMPVISPLSNQISNTNTSLPQAHDVHKNSNLMVYPSSPSPIPRRSNSRLKMYSIVNEDLQDEEEIEEDEEDNIKKNKDHEKYYINEPIMIDNSNKSSSIKNKKGNRNNSVEKVNNNEDEKGLDENGMMNIPIKKMPEKSHYKPPQRTSSTSRHRNRHNRKESNEYIINENSNIFMDMEPENFPEFPERGRSIFKNSNNEYSKTSHSVDSAQRGRDRNRNRDRGRDMNRIRSPNYKIKTHTPKRIRFHNNQLVLDDSEDENEEEDEELIDEEDKEKEMSKIKNRNPIIKVDDDYIEIERPDFKKNLIKRPEKRSQSLDTVKRRTHHRTESEKLDIYKLNDNLNFDNLLENEMNDLDNGINHYISEFLNTDLSLLDDENENEILESGRGRMIERYPDANSPFYLSPNTILTRKSRRSATDLPLPSNYSISSLSSNSSLSSSVSSNTAIDTINNVNITSTNNSNNISSPPSSNRNSTATVVNSTNFNSTLNHLSNNNKHQNPTTSNTTNNNEEDGESYYRISGVIKHSCIPIGNQSIPINNNSDYYGTSLSENNYSNMSTYRNNNNKRYNRISSSSSYSHTSLNSNSNLSSSTYTNNTNTTNMYAGSSTSSTTLNNTYNNSLYSNSLNTNLNNMNKKKNRTSRSSAKSSKSTKSAVSQRSSRSSYQKSYSNIPSPTLTTTTLTTSTTPNNNDSGNINININEVENDSSLIFGNLPEEIYNFLKPELEIPPPTRISSKENGVDYISSSSSISQQQRLQHQPFINNNMNTTTTNTQQQQLQQQLQQIQRKSWNNNNNNNNTSQISENSKHSLTKAQVENIKTKVKQVSIIPKQMTESYKRRVKIIGEILSTERTYTKELKNLINIYIEPLKRNGLLETEEFNCIFSNIEEIYRFHSLNFLPPLENVCHGSDMTIARFFLNISNSFQNLYSKYYYAFNNANTFLALVQATSQSSSNISSSRLRGLVPALKKSPYILNYPLFNKANKKRLKKFRNFMKDVCSRAEHSQFSLQGYLILPVQRLPRYLLLLEQLVKHSHSEDVDPHELEENKEAAEYMRTIVESCNSYMKQCEEKRILLEVTKTIRLDSNDSHGEMINNYLKIQGLCKISGAKVIRKGELKVLRCITLDTSIFPNQDGGGSGSSNKRNSSHRQSTELMNSNQQNYINGTMASRCASALSMAPIHHTITSTTTTTSSSSSIIKNNNEMTTTTPTTTQNHSNDDEVVNLSNYKRSSTSAIDPKKNQTADKNGMFYLIHKLFIHCRVNGILNHVIDLEQCTVEPASFSSTSSEFVELSFSKKTDIVLIVSDGKTQLYLTSPNIDVVYGWHQTINKQWEKVKNGELK